MINLVKRRNNFSCLNLKAYTPRMYEQFQITWKSSEPEGCVPLKKTQSPLSIGMKKEKMESYIHKDSLI